MNKSIFAVACCLSLAGCQTSIEDSATLVAQANIADSAGDVIGRARLYSLNDALTVNVSLEHAPAGEHAAHLHTTGNCAASDFTSAGGHLNPDARQHGSLNAQGPHLGDLPNIIVSAAGIGTMSARLDGSAADRLLQIFDADGAAVVIHDGADDYRSDPAGAAGSRIACGVLTRA